MEESPVAAAELGGVAKLHDGVEVSDDGENARLRGGGELIAVDGANAGSTPFGWVWQATVVIAGNANQLGSFA